MPGLQQQVVQIARPIRVVRVHVLDAGLLAIGSRCRQPAVLPRIPQFEVARVYIREKRLVIVDVVRQAGTCKPRYDDKQQRKPDDDRSAPRHATQ